MQPIWKDYYYTLGANNSYIYRILRDRVLVYAGRAVKLPSGQAVRIRLNDIIADHISSPLPEWRDEVASKIAIPDFALEIYEGGDNWNDLEDALHFFPDWSYDESHDAAVNGIAAPITRKVDARQPLFFSYYNKTEIPIVMTFEDGTTQSSTFDVSDAPYGTLCTHLINHPNLKTISMDGEVYEVAGACYDYALYYLNAFGGWDSLLIEGNNKRSDAVTRHTFEKSYDNLYNYQRGRTNYLNELTPSWTLYTGILSDEQSLRMHHLLNSPDVYLYNIAEDKMMSVVLTDGTAEHKTFKSNGRQVVTYTITCELAQERIRR